jgi:hypothetical protein
MSARPWGIGVVVGLAAAMVAVAPAQAATTWSIVNTPNRSTISNYLNGVAATAPNAAWAVGSSYDTSRAAPRTLIERWNGTSWAIVTSPNATPYYNELYAVDATSSTDAWAVGYANGSSGVNGSPRTTLALRWNGSAWSVVPTPNPGVSYRTLAGIEALTTTNAWAVGYYYETLSPAFLDALVLHWTGTAWTQVGVPVPANYLNQLYGVSASSASDVWAVGTYANLGEPNGARHPLALHYDGAAWSVVPVPTPPGGTAYLRGVKAISPTDAWAVGSKSGYSTPVAYHWDGRAWTEVPTPVVGAGGNNLFYGVAALSATQVWAVGYRSTGTGPQPLVERWNGTAWSVETLPSTPMGASLAGAAATGGGTTSPLVWGVGYRPDLTGSAPSDRTFALRGVGS